MKKRLPWFRCHQSELLGALSGLQCDEGYIYVLILLRIYETGGPIDDDPATLSRRNGMPTRRVAKAIEGLAMRGKITLLSDGRIDSTSTHEELSHQRESRQLLKSEAGKASAEKRAAQRAQKTPHVPAFSPPEKTQRNQQSGSTVVQLVIAERDTDEEKEGDKPLPNGGRARATYPADAFDVFYRRYPHKVAEPVARKEFEALIKSDAIAFKDLMFALETYCQTKPRDRKWCNPATWLREGRWNDRPASVVGDNGKSRGNGFSELAARKVSGDDTAYHDPFQHLDRPGFGQTG